MREKSKEENVKYDYCEIETKNVDLENSVAKLLSENEHLCNEINHVKQRMKILKAQIQDKAFEITSLKNNLRKVKEKEIIDIVAQIPSANIIVPGMFKLDLEPLAPRLLQNREAHIDYLKYTQEQDDILQGIKPTGHVFTEVRLKWKPTGRTFTIVGNSCPLTRITSANVVPPKNTTSHLVETQKPELKVYTRKPKNVKNVGSSKKAKIVESKNANHSEPNHTWGSNATDIPSSSSLVMTGCPDCSLLDSGTTILQGLWGMVTISWEMLLSQEYTIFLRTKDEAPEAIIKASKIQVHLNATVCNVRTDNGTEFVNQTLREFMKMLASHIKHLLPALLSRTVFSKGETELFSGPGLHSMTPATSSSGLVPNTVSQQPCIPPNRDDWDHLFQPMFDEYFNPPSIAVTPVQDAVAPRAVVLADSPVSTSIDQDAPSTSIPSTQEQEHSPNIS
ncbi:hypothetical protein Tco_1362285 [Tanacetum coccineum]